jgi:hypothetical protein
MSKKMLIACALLARLNLVAIDPIVEDGVFYYTQHGLIDCVYFKSALGSDREQQKNGHVTSSVGSSHAIQGQRWSGHHNHCAIAGINRITRSVDMRLAQDYSRQCTQREMCCVCAQLHLPPNFKDSFERRGFFQDLLNKNASPESYAHAFHQHIVAHCGPNYPPEVAACFQRAEMRRWSYYSYSGYRKYIRDLPVYEECMLEIAYQYRNDQKFAKKLGATEHQACSTIVEEEARILKKRAEKNKRELQEKHNRCRQEISEDIFREQLPRLHRDAQGWQETNSKRTEAYCATIQDCARRGLEYHALSPEAKKSLASYGCNPDEYVMLDGNSLQQELLQEIVDGVEIIATVEKLHESKQFDVVMHGATFEIFDGARRVNEMGDCSGAAQLIDLATTLVDYSAAAAQGVAEGILQGAHDGVVGTYHMIRHPLQTLEALGKVAVCIVKMSHDYVPIQKPLWLCTAEQEHAAYWKRHEEIARNWAELNSCVKTWWCETPSREKIRQATRGISSAVTNALVGHQCLQFAGKLCKLAAAETIALCRKAEQTEAVIAGIPPGEMSKIICNSMNEAELIAEAPAMTLVSKAQAVAELMQSCEQLGFSEEVLKKVMQRCEANEQFMNSLLARLKVEAENIRDVSKQAKGLGEKISKSKPLSHYKRISEIKDLEKLDVLSGHGYEKIRNLTYDIEKISQNTGIQTKVIKSAKDHLFLKEHNLGHGRFGRFDPCHDILDSWNRLIEGSFNFSDLELIQHEYYESLLMEIGELDYNMAHAETMKLFPWYA